MASDSPVLAENLAVLGDTAPRLAERLSWQVDHSHLLVAGDGSVSYRDDVKSMTPVRLAIAPGELPGEEALGRDAPLFLFGLGAGEILAHYLALFPGREIVAWERDPSLLRLTLSRVPVGPALRSGRLRLLLGADLLAEVPLAERYALVRHPAAGRLYFPERFLLDHPIGPRRAVVCEGGLFVSELAVELQQRGFGIYPLDFAHLSERESLLTLDQVGPELVAAINYPAGLAELCARARSRCKLLCWEIDPMIHTGRPVQGSTADSYLFTHRRDNVGELRDLGFQHVEQLPLAADPEWRKPIPLSPEQLARYAAPISFVGKSMVGDVPSWEALFLKAYAVHHRDKAGARSEAAGKALLAELLAGQREDFSRYRIPELLESRCRGWPPAELKRLARYAAEIASAERRVAYASRLARFGLQVWGDEGWRTAEAAGIAYRGMAGTYTDLTPIYCASTINLDIGRLHQLDIVTMRVFDALACGGFVLAERSADLESLFTIGEEIACYSTLDELEQKISHYLAHPDEARAIAAAGRRAVLERHTISKRVGTMLERMGLRA